MVESGRTLFSQKFPNILDFRAKRNFVFSLRKGDFVSFVKKRHSRTFLLLVSIEDRGGE